jgi:ABC-type branched-subunit amino acid transport system ATPase component
MDPDGTPNGRVRQRLAAAITRRAGGVLGSAPPGTETATPAGLPLLASKDLAAGYHGHPVIRGIDIEVNEGEVVALLGPNGAGKTTMLMALAGVLPALAGEVWFLGAKTTEPLHRRAARGLALVTERRSVFMRLTAADNLRVGRCDRERALELFPELRDLLSRYGGQLSGGEQQMLTLARALARRPKLLLADELSLGLAPRIVLRLLETVRATADQAGVGVLLVEQHVTEALRHADRVYAMSRGEIVLAGPSEEVAAAVRTAQL